MTMINALSPASVTPTSTSGVGQLGSDGFMKLLIAQLRYQSPLAPSDPTQMMQQTAQLGQMELLQKVASQQQQFLSMQQTSLAAGLVGTTITATTDAGTPLEGVVEAVRFTPQGPVLRVAGTEVPLDRAVELRGSTTTDPTTDTTTDTTTDGSA